jgi:OOP family OmpA-OmpF porin
MSYSNEKLDNYSSSVYANALFELFGEYAINSSFSVRPGFKFITRGQHIAESGFDYEFNAKYTELTLPVAYTFQAVGNANLYPYLLGGPVVGFARGGNINYSQNGDTSKLGINKGNLSSYSFGLYVGTGIKYSLLVNEFFSIVPGFEAGYHLGLTDTYSDKELSKKAEALNTFSYNISGTRKHRGFECGITISIPLANFKRVKLPEPKPEPMSVLKPEKLCYTIDEIKDLIRTQQNIQGKKICAIKQVSFKFGSSELTAQDKVYLDEMVILMETNKLVNIRVNGHTDNVGGEEFNMNLSRDRAKSVHDYLKSRGIAAGRLSFAYFGSTRPIADNNTEEGRAINRRVEFEIINQ